MMHPRFLRRAVCQSVQASAFITTGVLAIVAGCSDDGGRVNPDAAVMIDSRPPGDAPQQVDASVEAGAPTITVLSSPRPDLVSGGDALVEIKAPVGTALAQLTVKLNGQDVLPLLTPNQATSSVRGLITGLVEGANSLTATVGGRATELAIVNHPLTGPILAGPLQTPYECRTIDSGLGEPLDANCSATRKIEYFYRTTTGSFVALPDPLARPADLARTTVEGVDVPFVIRVDSGTINRTIYRIAILDDPTEATLDPATWHPGAGWNGRFMVSFGGGAGTAYHQGVNLVIPSGGNPGVLAGVSALPLARGFAFAISTELVNQTRGNAVLQGETLMMIKEYFIERYGVPRWTVGTGGSGGAIQQLTITQMYPGLLDGLQPSASFPDGSLHVADCGLLNHFYAKDTETWNSTKRAAVDGFFPDTCATWVVSFVPIIEAARVLNCGIDAAKIYHPVNNPTGARCTPQDTRVNVLGRDPRTGFARRPLDNVGVQYGLAAVNRGDITVQEFLDLNEGIGGYDIDGIFAPQRTVGDPIAIAASYESGLANSMGGGLANVPILHFRGYTDNRRDIHSRERDFNIRARLIKANGDADNQVIWVGPAVEPSGFSLAVLALDAMTKWLDAMAADPAPLSHAKVVAHKPAEATDACFDATGMKIVEPQAFDADNRCNTIYPVHSEPRMVAGAPLTNDVAKCQLKPIDFTEYQVSFTLLEKIRALTIFAGGVCDFAKPGVNQLPLKGTYQKY